MLELMIAVAIFFVIVPSGMAFAVSSRARMDRNRSMRGAIFLASSRLETALASTSASFDSVADGPGMTVFERTPCAKSLLASATSSGVRVSFSALATSQLERDKLGKDCDQGQRGGGPLMLRISPAFQGDTITSIDIVGKRLFAASVSAGTSTLLELAISSSTALERARVAVTARINAIDAVDGYVFASTDGPSLHVAIFDVRAPPALVLVATTSLPGVGGSYPNATSVAYRDGTLFVGTHRTAGNELHAFDVRDPPNRRWLGSLELNHNLNAIATREDSVFLATSGNTSHLIVVDASDPARMRQAAALALPGTEDASSIFLTGRQGFIGRKSGHGTRTVSTIDLSDPTAPATSSTSAQTAAALGVVASGDTLYIANSRAMDATADAIAVAEGSTISAIVRTP